MDAEADGDAISLRDLRAVSVLGRGAKGVVFHARREGEEESLALKVISRSVVEGSYRRIRFERDVLAALRHPLLPSLRGFVETEEVIAFAMDRCPGGDLNSLRKRQTERTFSEGAIRFYAAEIVLALEHLHGQGIVYRDLKPENILVQSNGHIMLVDFDLSTRLPPASPPPPPTPARKPRRRRRIGSPCLLGSKSATKEEENEEEETCKSSSSGKSNSFVGTEEYVAPEVIEGKGHEYGVDWWGLGVVIYEMLYGRTPFRGQNRKETFYRIVSMAPDLAGERTALRDLIGRLLEKDPGRRLGREGVRDHEFFRGMDWDAVVSVARPPFIPAAEEEAVAEGEGIDVEVFVKDLLESIEAARRKKKAEEGKAAERQWVAGVGAANRVAEFGVF